VRWKDKGGGEAGGKLSVVCLLQKLRESSRLAEGS
jgi:hypothetical protein